MLKLIKNILGNLITPTIRMNPHLVHSVYFTFGVHMLSDELYQTYWPEWSKYTSIHMLINHRHYLDEESPIKEFDQFNIQDYNFTYGYMDRDVLKRIKLYF